MVVPVDGEARAHALARYELRGTVTCPFFDRGGTAYAETSGAPTVDPEVLR
jgi:hypothetical protein